MHLRPPVGAVVALACALLPGMTWTATSGPSAALGRADPQLWPRATPMPKDPQIEALISRLLDQMSLEEKVGQLIQADIESVTPADLRDYPLGSVVAGGNSPPLGATLRASPQSWLDTARAFRAASTEVRAGHTPIPILFAIDAVHGNAKVRGATVFPHNIGLGATHDPGLIERIGAATAQESLAVGFDWVFAPTVAVPQDLRWGRSYESYAQDPALVATDAAALVRGLQGEPNAAHSEQLGHVAATAKHFIGDGATVEGVDQGDSEVSEGELVHVDAPGYVATIEADVMTVMASYSSWQHVKMHGNESLLTDVLKNRLGFDGFVISDWKAYAQLPGCGDDDCLSTVLAGVDMLMAADAWKALFGHLLQQARSGALPPARLDDAVRRILRVKASLGLLEAPQPLVGNLELLGSPSHRALAREAVRKSIVLLKNERHTLPIRADAHVLVVGEAADDIGRQCGGWTLSWQGDGNRNRDFPQGESVFSGLRSALAAGGGEARRSVFGQYRRRPDVAVVVYGEHPYAEGLGDRHSLDYERLQPKDLALLRRLRRARVPIVSIFLSGRPLETTAAMDASDAFVAAWLPGTEGAGIADVLVADARGQPRYDFSGTLSFAWPGARRGAGYPMGFGLTYGATE